MALVIVSRLPPPSSPASSLRCARSLFQTPPHRTPRRACGLLPCSRGRVRVSIPTLPLSPRLGLLTSRCSLTNADVDVDYTPIDNDVSEGLSPGASGCSLPVIHLKPQILDPNPANFLNEEVPSELGTHALAATPDHPAGLYALYASFLLGNLVEQSWNFIWPAAVAILHPSLLPIAVVGFFTKLAIFIAAPMVGKLMDNFPRLPAYHSLNFVQTVAQLLSAGMIIYAMKAVKQSSPTLLLTQPWFIVLVVAGAIERLAGLALGVTVERDWVVLLAGKTRPVALAQANSILSRIDLFSEIAGASVFGMLLSKYDLATCLKFACILMMCVLPILVVLGEVINRLSDGVLDCSKFHGDTVRITTSFNAGKLVENGLDCIRHGWNEYKHQPVLPASLAYVLLYFNVALAPGAIMTALLTHHGISPSIIGGFSGLCSFMGFAATFISASLVKEFGLLKAGAAGLLVQAFLLTTAVTVYWGSSIKNQTPLIIFLSLIVLSRLGHMSYDVVGTQILQTGIPNNKANLIGTTELSIASLAELLMLGVAIIANDVSHFGFLAMLSVTSVVGAACMFCRWLANPTDKHRKLFNFDLQ